MPYIRRSTRHVSTEKKALMFGIFLMTVLCVSLITIASNAKPFVLGTERNTDGRIEYLCLGKGCEQVF